MRRRVKTEKKEWQFNTQMRIHVNILLFKYTIINKQHRTKIDHTIHKSGLDKHKLQHHSQ